MKLRTQIRLVIFEWVLKLALKVCPANTNEGADFVVWLKSYSGKRIAEALGYTTVAPAQERLQDILGEQEGKSSLTAHKAAWCMKAYDQHVTGFVVTSKTGLSALVYKSAVRWLTHDDMWWLMHESDKLATRKTEYKD